MFNASFSLMDFDLVYKFQMICIWGTYFSGKQLQDERTDDIQTSVKLNTPLMPCRGHKNITSYLTNYVDKSNSEVRNQYSNYLM